MRRFTSLTVGASVLALAACHGPAHAVYDATPATYYASGPTSVCVDPRTQVRVPDYQCQTGMGAGSPFMWYYMPYHSVMPYYGQHYYGGTFRAAPGTRYSFAPRQTSVAYSAAPKVVSRGALGASARSGVTTSMVNPMTGKSGYGGFFGSKASYSTSTSYSIPSTSSYSSRPSSSSFGSSFSSSRSSFSSSSFSGGRSFGGGFSSAGG